MFDFAVIDAAGRYVGGCGLNQIQRANAVANLGYWTRSSASGCGMAPAAVRMLIAWAFQNTNLNRLEILVAVANTRSLRVAEKVGAHRDAVLRQRLIVDGRPSDAVPYSVLRADADIGES